MTEQDTSEAQRAYEVEVARIALAQSLKQQLPTLSVEEELKTREAIAKGDHPSASTRIPSPR